MEHRLIELEKKVAFQDRQLEELSQVLVEQQKILDELCREVARIREHARSGDLMKLSQEERSPPHY
jgi:SlyX protein